MTLPHNSRLEVKQMKFENKLGYMWKIKKGLEFILRACVSQPFICIINGWDKPTFQRESIYFSSMIGRFVVCSVGCIAFGATAYRGRCVCDRTGKATHLVTGKRKHSGSCHLLEVIPTQLKTIQHTFHLKVFNYLSQLVTIS